MPDYRNIHTEIWSDPWVAEQTPLDKLLFIYLFSNPRSNLAGLYDITVRQIAFDTGLEQEQILDGLERFAAAAKAFYEDGAMWVPKMPIRNAFNLRSPKVQTNIANTLIGFRNCTLRNRAIEYWNHIIAPQYGIDTISIPPLHIISYHIISETDHIIPGSATDEAVDPPTEGGASAPPPPVSPPPPKQQGTSNRYSEGQRAFLGFWGAKRFRTIAAADLVRQLEKQYGSKKLIDAARMTAERQIPLKDSIAYTRSILENEGKPKGKGGNRGPTSNEVTAADAAEIRAQLRRSRPATNVEATGEAAGAPG